ncbi:MAG: hypothetical protein ACR2N7_10820 [Acidimicrobiia bacterium]
MDLFGIGGHDDRHDAVELQLRRLIEQVAQLSIDLGVTRTDMRRLYLEVQGKVDDADVDPAIVALNEGIKNTRDKLAAAQEAAEDNWATTNEQLTEAVDELRRNIAESEA